MQKNDKNILYMNPLYKIYSNRPGNYVLVGETGGAGKSVMLRCLHDTLLRQSTVSNPKWIPIYFKLSALNMGDSIGEPLYDRVRKLCDTPELGRQQVIKLISKHSDTKFVFLLDGYNEIIFRKVGTGSDVFSELSQEILELNLENVDFIISSRNVEVYRRLKDRTLSELKLLKIRPFTEKQINEYLGIGSNVELPFVANSMMLKMTKRVMEEELMEKEKSVQRITSKYALMNRYFKDELSLKRNEWKEGAEFSINVYQKTFEKYVPFVAFKITKYLIQKALGNDDSKAPLYGRVIWEIYEEDKVNFPDYTPYDINQALKTTGYITDEESIIFSHDSYRDFFAAKAVLEGNESIDAEELEKYMLDLAKVLNGDGKADITPQTQFLELAQFIYEGAKELTEDENPVAKILEDENHLADKEKACNVSFRFYFELAGLYELLDADEKSYELGYLAYDNMPATTGEDPLSEAGVYNFIECCVRKYKPAVGARDCLGIIEQAEKYLSKAEQHIQDMDENQIEKYHRLKRVILSNKAAYYISNYAEDPERALKMQFKTLELAKEYETSATIAEVYRTIMTSYAHIGRACENEKEKAEYYIKAYNAFCDGVSALTGKRNLSEGIGAIEEAERSALVMRPNFVLRALVNELQLLKNDNVPYELKEELFQEAEYQVRYAYEKIKMNVDDSQKNYLIERLKEYDDYLHKIENNSKAIKALQKTVIDYLEKMQ